MSDGRLRPPENDPLRSADALVFVDNLDHPELQPDDRHHLLHVLRLRAGSPVVAADGAGNWRPCRLAPAVDATSRSTPRRGTRAVRPVEEVELAVEGDRRQVPSHRRITVGFALQKGDRSDWTVQKLTEIGVDRILPFISERTIVRLDSAAIVSRAARFRRVAREAAMQCRRPLLPEIEDPADFTAVLASLDGHEVALAEPGGGILPPETATLLIGPEGGWTLDEIEAGPATVGLGPHILRAETAAIVGATMLAVHHAWRTHD